MTHYLVTGGAGFIGSHIAEFLVRNGDQVSIIDNLETGSEENIASFRSGVRFLNKDIRNSQDIDEATRHVDYVIHQAAIPSVPRSVADPRTTNSVNVDGTLEVLLAARNHKVKRVIFASSSSVYGSDPEVPKIEERTGQPRSPYALSKLAGEIYCRLFYELYGLETVVLRYFNVFGPRQNFKSQYAAVIPNFVRALQNENRPIIYSDGEQSRDFTYVENVVKANILACNAPHAAGQIMNVGCGTKTTVNHLFQVISEIMGVDVPPEYQPARQGDVRHSLASIEKSRKILGYEPNTNLKSGLVETVLYIRSSL